LILGLLAAFIASAIPHSGAYSQTQNKATNSDAYDDAILETMNEHCIAGTGNAKFCTCMIRAIKRNLPPEYAVLYTVSVGENQQQYFATSNDLPGYIEDRMSGLTSYCRRKSEIDGEP